MKWQDGDAWNASENTGHDYESGVADDTHKHSWVAEEIMGEKEEEKCGIHTCMYTVFLGR